jgi:hypothetical protein
MCSAQLHSRLAPLFAQTNALRLAVGTIALLFLALISLLCWFPPDDSPTYDECLDFETRTQTPIAVAPSEEDMAPATTLLTTTTEQCLKARTQVCREWRRERNFLGRKYKHCAEYD